MKLLLAYLPILTESFGYFQESSSQDSNDCSLPDYIVVGGGSSGAIVAARLASASECVVLIEAGGDDNDAPTQYIPLLSLASEFTDITYTHWTSDEFTTPRDRPDQLPADLGYPPSEFAENEYRGKILGGTSMVNNMVYLRGGNASYDAWGEGWTAKEVVPAFDAMERHLGHLNPASGTPAGEAAHGAVLADGFSTFNGPCRDISNAKVDSWCPYHERTVDLDGRRISTASAFLTPEVRASPYLTIMTETRVLKLVFQDDVVTGVEYESKNETGILEAGKEVILSAGALMSPQILMVSGIGPKADLEEKNVTALKDLPVGRFVQGHVVSGASVPLVHEADGLNTLGLIGLSDSFTGISRFTPDMTLSEGFGMMYSSECRARNCTQPDVEITLIHAATSEAFQDPEDIAEVLAGAPNGSVAFLISRYDDPQFQGTISLKSADPRDYPLFDANYLSSPEDIEVMIEGYDRVSSIVSHRPDTFHPVRMIPFANSSLEATIEATASTHWHTTGSCRMGTDPTTSVVDHELKVHGLQNLRIVDASIAPKIPNANTNAMAMMIGYRAAEIILGRPILDDPTTTDEPPTPVPTLLDDVCSEEMCAGITCETPAMCTLLEDAFDCTCPGCADCIGNKTTNETACSSARVCPLEASITFQGDGKATIFDQLTVEEIAAIKTLALERGLISVVDYEAFSQDPDYASKWKTATWMDKIELQAPSKADALAYLDGVGPVPVRRAEFWYFTPSKEVAILYQVGPLPVDGTTSFEEVPIPGGRVSWVSRPISVEETYAAQPALVPTTTTLFPIFTHFLGQLSGDNGIAISVSLDHELSDVYSRIFHLFFYTDLNGRGTDAGASLKPLPLRFSWNHTYKVSTPAEMPTLNYYLCNEGPYASAEKLMDAFTAGLRCDLDAEFYASNLNTIDPVGPLRETFGAPPRIYYPSGQRLASNGKNIEWQGWAFHVDASPTRGLQFFDVRFKGDRIIYELATTDFAATYSSASTLRGVTFSDGAIDMGSSVTPAVPYVDCPPNSLRLDGIAANSQYATNGEATVVSGALCIFEAPDYRRSLVRQHPPTDITGGGLPSTVLIVRSVISIGNYEYIQDATFFLDGRVEIAKAASGYMLGSYQDDPKFGQKIRPSVTGTLHQHHSAFKVDLDVVGTANSFQTTKFNVHETPPSVTKTIEPTETSFYKSDRVGFDFLSDVTNSWGEKRGYEIVLGDTIIPSPDHQRNFTKHNIAVTQRKDYERYDNTPNGAFFFPLQAPYDISRYLDDESIDQTDLVAWLSFTKLHYPRSEDLPMPIILSSSFELRPHNYFDRAAYSDLPPVDTVTPSCLQPL